MKILSKVSLIVLFLLTSCSSSNVFEPKFIDYGKKTTRADMITHFSEFRDKTFKYFYDDEEVGRINSTITNVSKNIEITLIMSESLDRKGSKNNVDFKYYWRKDYHVICDVINKRISLQATEKYTVDNLENAKLAVLPSRLDFDGVRSFNQYIEYENNNQSTLVDLDNKTFFKNDYVFHLDQLSMIQQMFGRLDFPYFVMPEDRTTYYAGTNSVTAVFDDTFGGICISQYHYTKQMNYKTKDTYVIGTDKSMMCSEYNVKLYNGSIEKIDYSSYQEISNS